MVGKEEREVREETFDVRLDVVVLDVAEALEVVELVEEEVRARRSRWIGIFAVVDCVGEQLMWD